MILISSIPVNRAGHSIDALKAGKDVIGRQTRVYYPRSVK